MESIYYNKTLTTKLCTMYGICGKNPIVSALQDLLIYGLKGLSIYSMKLREYGVVIAEVDSFVAEALLSTVSNVQFNPDKHKQFLFRLAELKDKAYEIYLEVCVERNIIPEQFNEIVNWQPEESLAGLISQGEKASVQRCKIIKDTDLLALQDLVLYGLKSISAYVDISHALGTYIEDKTDISTFLQEVLSYLAIDNPDEQKLIDYALSCGELNLKAMKLLNKSHADLYGEPLPSKVKVNKVKGKAILVTGHDLKALEHLLKQTQGKNINVYTHGEMLCAHSYPELNKYKHLIGNFGESWQTPERDFESFPGPILLTSSCVIEPTEIYRGRIFTTGPIAWSGTEVIENFDCSKIIDATQQFKGFSESEPEKYINIGFSSKSVPMLTDKIIKLVEDKKVKNVYLIGGCNSTDIEMNYYSKIAKKLASDSLILTLGCGRFNLDTSNYGIVDGIPRVINIGQCNDSYSVVKIATDIAEAFNVKVTHIPFFMILSWQEQKSIAMLLSLIYLGVENIMLSKNLPVFVSPNIYKVLKNKFNIKEFYDDLN